MEKREVNPVVLIAVAVVLVALLGYFGFRAMQPPTPAAGSYTPGVPPWMDKQHQNVGNVQAPPSAATH